MKKTFFVTNNYHRMVEGIEALKNREPSLHGLGLIYGRWGWGKSETVEYYYGQSNAYYVRAARLWSPRDLLEAICDELQILPEYRTVSRFNQVCKELRRRKEPLIIDEADYLFKRDIHLDVIRDIHDISRVPIILVGMEQALAKLERYGQFWSRILPAGIVEFKPLSPPEMTLVTREWTGLDMEPESAEELCRMTEGDFRLVAGCLEELEKACRVNKKTAINLPMIKAVKRKIIARKKVITSQRKDHVKQIYSVGRGK